MIRSDPQSILHEKIVDPEELFAAFRTGYRALVELLQAHREYLLKIVNDEMPEKLRARAGASDIVQNALVNVLEMTRNRLFAVDSEEHLRAWLRRVCVNSMRKTWRDERRARRNLLIEHSLPEKFEARAGDPSPSSECRRLGAHEGLEQAVNALAEADRMLIRLRRDGWSYMAMAELLEGQKSEAGRVRLQRRLNQLLIQLAADPRVEDVGD